MNMAHLLVEDHNTLGSCSSEGRQRVGLTHLNPTSVGGEGLSTLLLDGGISIIGSLEGRATLRLHCQMGAATISL